MEEPPAAVGDSDGRGRGNPPPLRPLNLLGLLPTFRPLATEELAMVAQRYESVEAETTVVAQYKNDYVELQQYKTLQAPSWINDAPLNMFLKILLDTHNGLDRQDDPLPSAAFSSFFWTKLLGDDEVFDFDRVCTWQQSTTIGDVFQLRYLFFPVNVDEDHWSLVVADFPAKTLRCLDSYGHRGTYYLNHAHEYLKHKHRQLYKEELPHWDLIESSPLVVPQQGNTWDCGPFICSYVHQILLGQTPSWPQSVVENYRHYIAYCLLQKHLID